MRIYYVYLAIAAIVWGLNFHLAKVMLSHTSIIEAGLWRYVFGVFVLFIISLKYLPAWSVIVKYSKALFYVGFIGLFGFNFFFFLGISKTSAINASLIASLNPAFTLICSYVILSTAITRNQILGIFMALLGVFLLILKGDLGAISSITVAEGDFWMLIACLVFALHHVWVKKYAKGLPNQSFTFLTNAVCLAGFFLILPFQPLGTISSYPLSFWGAAIGMGAVGTALAYYLWNLSVAKVGPLQAGIFINLVPLSTAMFAIFLGELVHWYHILSGTIILCGIFIMQRPAKGAVSKVIAPVSQPSSQKI